ncbi:hypothetical protein ABIF62_003026 [Bradyrhizobium japonicum]
MIPDAASRQRAGEIDSLVSPNGIHVPAPALEIWNPAGFLASNDPLWFHFKVVMPPFWTQLVDFLDV